VAATCCTPPEATPDPPIVRLLKGPYWNLLVRVEKHPRLVSLGVVTFVAGGLSVAPFLQSAFLPQFREGSFIVHVTAIPGTSLQESLRIGELVSRELLKLPYVGVVSQKTGRAELGSSTRGIDSSEIDVNLKGSESLQTEFTLGKVNKALEQFAGVSFGLNTFLTERIDETISGYTAPVAINIFGNHLDFLHHKGQEIAGILREIPGAFDVSVESRSGSPQVVIELKHEDLRRWGFDPMDVLESVRTAYQGSVVGQVYENGRVFNVSAILNPELRRDASAIGGLLLRSGGSYIALRELAHVFETSGRYVVLHNDGRRVETVTCNVMGRDVSSFVDEAKKRIRASITLPADNYMDFTGSAAAAAQSRRDLLFYSLMSAVGIVLLLTIVLGNYRNVLLILLNLPLALVGGVLAVFLSGGILSLGSMVGFVTLFGITLRNSIMMISHYEHMVCVEGVEWGLEAALKGACDRLIPILMTAMVTGLGLLPLAVGSGAAGQEIEGRLAIVILGGLVTSTLLNLLVVPTLALRYGQFQPRLAEE